MSLLRDIRDREVELLSCERFRRRWQVSNALINRLGLQLTLEGHSGCVNCLQWSTNGQMLASGSDDCRIIIWTPFRGLVKHTEIRTSHRGNIFSVKFMPWQEDRLVVSGAADHMIQLHDLTTQKTVQTYSSHLNRVKRVDVAQDCPDLVWSAAEDGLILQTDTRCPPSKIHILVHLHNLRGQKVEAKCLSINPRRSEYLAVGANDVFVRIYDRRKMQPTQVDTSLWGTDFRPLASVNRQDSCAQYYAPGHLMSAKKEVCRWGLFPRAVTYVSFSPDGKNLLVNLGRDHVYLFDTINANTMILGSPEFEQFLGPSIEDPEEYRSSEVHQGDCRKPLSGRVESLKNKGNLEYNKGCYSAAIAIYNEAIQYDQHPILLGNRAAALLKRNWNADVYSALKDCYAALKLDPSYEKVHLRLAKCLLRLHFIHDADLQLQKFHRMFPSSTHPGSLKALEKELSLAKERAQSDKIKIPDWKTLIRDHLDEVGDGLDDISDSPDRSSENVLVSKLLLEKHYRSQSWDFSQRFWGHSNTSTDIKEANFFGSDSQYVVAGSDDGMVYCWDRFSSNIVRVLKGDSSTVNCVQGHPTGCVLATSGIDNEIRLWGPLPEDGSENERLISNNYLTFF